MSTQSEPYILAMVRNTAYAVPSRQVERMEMVEQVTPVPNAPLCVDGIVFSRGQVVPVINLRRRFGLEPTDYDLRTRIVVTRVDNRRVGLLVDAAREFVHLPEESIQPPPDTVSGAKAQYLRGIATLNQRTILVLDIAGLVAGTVES